MSIPQHIVQALVELGAPDGAPDEHALLDVLDPYARTAHNHNPNGEWRRLASSMEPDELQCLIRGVIRAEENGKWYGGSVSIVIPLYRAYQDKRQPNEEELTNWVMRTSSNCYAPTGRNRGGARSLAELREQNEREWVRKESAAVEEKRRAEEGDLKKKAAAERHVHRMEDQSVAVAERNAEVERLLSLSVEERLSFLMRVPPRKLGYYPVSLLGSVTDAVRALSIDQRTELVQLIRTSGDKAWRSWARDILGQSGEENGDPV